MGQNRKLYDIRGLDLRTNELYRQEGTASDLRNVRLDSNKNLIKREDFLNLNIPRGVSGEVGAFTDKLPFDAVIEDMVPFEDHIVLFCSMRNTYAKVPETFTNVSILYRYFKETNTVEKIFFNGYSTVTPAIGQNTGFLRGNFGGKIQTTIINNSLYFMGDQPASDNLSFPEFTERDPEYGNGLNSIMKYDGKVFHKAGLTRAISEDTAETLPANTKFARIIQFYIDDNGFTHFSDFSRELIPDTGVDTETVNYTMNNFDVTEHVANVIPNETKLIFEGETFTYTPPPVSGGEAIQVGQHVYTITKSPFPIGTPTQSLISIFRIEIAAISGTTITAGKVRLFLEDQWSDIISQVSIEAGVPLTAQLGAVYSSTERERGFELQDIIRIGPLASGLNQPVVTNLEPVLSSLAIPINLRFEDTFDPNFVKNNPPYVKSLTDFNGALLCIDDDLTYFSDISVGGNVEAFVPTDNFRTGSEKRGKVTGLFANETFIAVFREQESYYITGNIFTGNFRTQSYRSTRIGCSSPAGITEIAGAALFPTPRGIYVALQGGTMEELSDIIEPMFVDNELDLDLDMTTVDTKVDFLREYVLMSIKSKTEGKDIILLYSYYHQEWFIYDQINFDGGFFFLDDKIYVSDGQDVLEETIDFVNGFDAYYQSNFETLGYPALLKRFFRIKLHTIGQEESTSLNISTYKNWQNPDENSPVTQESDQLAQENISVVRRLNPDRVFSHAFRITSEGTNDMKLNGYEYEYEADQEEYDSKKTNS